MRGRLQEIHAKLRDILRVKMGGIRGKLGEIHGKLRNISVGKRRVNL